MRESVSASSYRFDRSDKLTCCPAHPLGGDKRRRANQHRSANAGLMLLLHPRSFTLACLSTPRNQRWSLSPSSSVVGQLRPRPNFRLSPRRLSG
mmetsp:Transcript_31157/g.67089  ORF Transcript_31157/g.67089 Transcript_31157/m.67089 type:complete len:94 (-) Transcript_31157:115-396(-)